MIETRDYIDDHPKLNVTLLPENVKGVAVPCLALLDTGASYSVFPEKYAEDLGIDAGVLPQVQIVTPLSNEPIWINIGMVPLDFGFAKYKTVVGFHKIDYAVLGHVGFFDHFKVAFDTANRKFMITDMAIPDRDAS
jgi:hypothetical protein